MPLSCHDAGDEHGRFGGLDRDEDCFQSLETFVDEVAERVPATYSCFELQCLCWNIRRSPQDLIRELASLGATLFSRATPRRIRTFSSNPHDRWYGPGSEPTHGGSGFDNRD